MKFTNQTFMLSFQNEATLGPRGIVDLTLLHHAFIARNEKGEIVVDLDMGVDVQDIKFLNTAVTDSYAKFKEHLSGLGIDLENLIEEEIQRIINTGLEDDLIDMFGDKV